MSWNVVERASDEFEAAINKCFIIAALLMFHFYEAAVNIKQIQYVNAPSKSASKPASKQQAGIQVQISKRMLAYFQGPTI